MLTLKPRRFLANGLAFEAIAEKLSLYQITRQSYDLYGVWDEVAKVRSVWSFTKIKVFRVF